jgi:hypothetical protein
MVENNQFYNDMIEALNEVEEYQKGNIQLKTTTYEEVIIADIMRKLSDDNKEKLIKYATELLYAANV